GEAWQKNIRERGCPRGARDNTPLPEGSVPNDPTANGDSARQVVGLLLGDSLLGSCRRGVGANSSRGVVQSAKTEAERINGHPWDVQPLFLHPRPILDPSALVISSKRGCGITCPQNV